MKKNTAFIAVVLALASSAFVSAQDAAQSGAQKKVTVEEAVNLAMENNISLASSAIDVRMKQRDNQYAWNVFVPNVQATGTLGRMNTVSDQMGPIMEMINPFYVPAEITEKDHWFAASGLSIGLNLNLALFDGLKATRQAYEAGQLQYEQARKQTETNVRKAFYGILVQQGSLAIAKEKLTAAEARLRQTKTNFSNGLVPELNYLQTQLSVETQKPVIEEAELNLEQQKNFFAFTLGLPVGTQLVLDGEINPSISAVNADELVLKHLADRLDLALLRKNIELLDTQYRATQIQRFTPSLSLSQTWSPRLSAIDDSWTDKDNWTDSSGAFSMTLAFNLTNLLPFSATGQNVEDTKDSAKKLELTLRQAAYSAELEIRNLAKKLEKVKTSIATMELSASIADKAYRLTEQGYKAGTIEYLDLKDAENSLLQAKLGVLAEKYNYISTMLDLETALNTKLN